jgi:uncharacterized Ntn-hydrolase superfamily protein
MAVDEACHGRARRSAAGHGAPARDGVRGSGGAKPSGQPSPVAVIRRSLLAFALVGVIASACVYLRAQSTPQEPPGTFSILGFDPATGEVGGAVQSRVFSVGNGVLWAEAGVGAAATQAIVDVSYGPKAIELLKAGMTPGAIIPAILGSDPDPGLNGQTWTKEGRQFAVMDAKGNYAAHTGPQATPWAGHSGGKFCTAQGNILAGEAVVSEMVRAFEATTGHLSLRLMAALDAGQAAGGDKRGKQSAAMLIVKKDGGVWLHNDVVLRLQVDDNPEPLVELRRLVEMNARRFRAR